MWLWQGATPRAAARLGLRVQHRRPSSPAPTGCTSASTSSAAGAGVARVVPDAGAGRHHGPATTRCSATSVARWLPPRGALRWLRRAAGGVAAASSGGAAGSCRASRGCRSATRRPTPGLRGFAPLVGVYGISALLLVCAGALVTLALGTPRRARSPRSSCCCCPGARARRSTGTPGRSASGAPVSVAVVQGAIPQDEKWHREQPRHDAQPLPVRSPRRRSARSSSCGRSPRPPTSPTTSSSTSRNLYREAQRARSRDRHGRAARRGPAPTTTQLLQLGAGARATRAGLVRQASPRAVRRVLPGAALRAQLAAPHEPAVLGLHARRGRAAAAARPPA